MIRVYGIDPSLTSLGISDGVRHEAIRTEAGEPLMKRVAKIAGDVCRFIDAEKVLASEMLWVIEAPLLSSAMGSGHLYELGFVMHRLYQLAEQLTLAGMPARIIEVPSPTLRKWALGRGNVPKAEMPLAVYKKFGVEFQDDRGADRLFAFLLHRYGCAVLAGEVQHVPSKPRGRGKDAVAERKRAMKTRGVAA